MSRDYKLNKSELTRLKRQERLYAQYLPVLKLKQEQLQIEYNRVKKNLENEMAKLNEELHGLSPYVPCFVDSFGPRLQDLCEVEEIRTFKKSVAGVEVRALEGISFKSVHLSLFQTPAWVVQSLPLVHRYLNSQARIFLLEEERDVIKRELRKATQKVNLFDMVLIPKTKVAIKRIKISLGDEQVASISRGKIAKNKGQKDNDAFMSNANNYGAEVSV